MDNQTVCKGRLSLIASRRNPYYGVIRGRSGADVGTYHRLDRNGEIWVAQFVRPGTTSFVEMRFSSQSEILETLAAKIFPPEG